MRSTEFDLTATFRTVEGGWVQASIVELPGVITAAPTREEAEELLLDALREYLLATGSSPEREGHVVADATGDDLDHRRLAVTIAAT